MHVRLAARLGAAQPPRLRDSGCHGVHAVGAQALHGPRSHAQGRSPANALEAALTERGVFNTLIGDSAQPGRIGDAVHAAYRAVQALGAEYSTVGHAGF